MIYIVELIGYEEKKITIIMIKHNDFSLHEEIITKDFYPKY